MAWRTQNVFKQWRPVFTSLYGLTWIHSNKQSVEFLDSLPLWAWGTSWMSWLELGIHCLYCRWISPTSSWHTPTLLIYIILWTWLPSLNFEPYGDCSSLGSMPSDMWSRINCDMWIELTKPIIHFLRTPLCPHSVVCWPLWRYQWNCGGHCELDTEWWRQSWFLPHWHHHQWSWSSI